MGFPLKAAACRSYTWRDRLRVIGYRGVPQMPFGRKALAELELLQVGLSKLFPATHGVSQLPSNLFKPCHLRRHGACDGFCVFAFPRDMEESTNPGDRRLPFQPGVLFID